MIGLSFRRYLLFFYTLRYGWTSASIKISNTYLVVVFDNLSVFQALCIINLSTLTLSAALTILLMYLLFNISLCLGEIPLIMLIYV